MTPEEQLEQTKKLILDFYNWYNFKMNFTGCNSSEKTEINRGEIINNLCYGPEKSKEIFAKLNNLRHDLGEIFDNKILTYKFTEEEFKEYSKSRVIPD